MSFDRDLFLPVTKEDMARRGWEGYDFLLITGDAYVDHPSFGPAIIGRVLEAEGYRPMTYSNPNLVSKGFDISQLQDYPFWLAHYTTGWQPTSFPYYYDMWQYSSSGTVDGIEGRVDLNICLVDF